MKLKKLNAALSLLSVALLLAHLGYNVYTYLTFRYHPVPVRLLANAASIAICLHAILGMCLVFLMGDGTRLAGYGRQNLGTVLQRVTAALMFPLLLVHVGHYATLMAAAQSGQMGKVAGVLALEIVFYADVIVHIAVSFSRALITLGWLQKPKTKKVLDRVAWVLGAVLFLLAVFSVTRTQLTMFLY